MSRAKITVTTGPDRGKSCALGGDLTRLGRSAENDLVLSDSELADHLASIVQRDGRYAIITMVPGGLEIDGTEIPVERWVWLPETAQIRASRRTSLEFVQEEGVTSDATGNGAEADSPDEALPVQAPAEAPPVEVAAGRRSVEPKPVRSPAPRTGNGAPGSSGELPRTRRSDKKSRTVARFITDGPGDPLVKLGEDGHLPELALKEGHLREARSDEPKQTKPAVLAVVVILSLGLSLTALLLDSGMSADNTARKLAARREIVEYYGEEGETLQPYQMHLRWARQARSRGDLEAERSEFHQVLTLLRSEVNDKLYRYTGLTGRLDYMDGDESKKSDRRLEELISILLGD